MSDLLTILPSFPQTPFAAMLPTLEQHRLSTTDLLALHPADIAKQTRLPILDLKRLIAAIQACLSDDLVPCFPLERRNGTADAAQSTQAAERGEGNAQSEEQPGPEAASSIQGDDDDDDDKASGAAEAQTTPSHSHAAYAQRIGLLDPALDSALGGGIPVGSITEITGESGSGKTQFLLTLCLAVQLPPPHGLSKQALYISTEAGLATRRLSQILAANDTLLAQAAAENRPSLDGILSAATPDLESQDHILEYQVPVLLSRHSIGLVVIDSVAANYRAEFERAGSSYGSNMAARTAELVRLGALLRNLARKHRVAVVVANQVADRFASPATPRPHPSRAVPGSAGGPESPLASRSAAAPPPPPPSSSPAPYSFPDPSQPLSHPALRLEHQQRWFTGWGDDPRSSCSLKTPSLGLVWSAQISCRIALFKRPVYARRRQVVASRAADDDADTGPTLNGWRRWMKIVFASHVPASGQGLEGATEFDITMGGVKSTSKQARKQKQGEAEGQNS
ncbi:uncharacterized protein UV8b_05303 [Ustilaginoidea virens]|uniref:RecA family profile 1 domain-containing protein n=1 Tax=Ustilaginoidea virens TaxID=1159556 RepID=A0A8E5HTF3_USTVR|nr:uncharacterized protein UV8b_05303 [Ustilaginoidea virens]QUC21060.1 hypothetical protein UV8b_05303 [Ustilaginoidea virens]